MKRIFFIVVVLSCSAIITGLAGCNKDKECKEWEQTPIEPQALLNTTWKCVGFVNTKSCKIKGSGGTLIFYEDEKLSGRICNHFAGNHKIDFIAGNINICIYAATEMLCTQSVGEDLFIETLNKIQFFSMQGNELRLYYNNNKNYLLFKQL